MCLLKRNTIYTRLQWQLWWEQIKENVHSKLYINKESSTTEMVQVLSTNGAMVVRTCSLLCESASCWNMPQEGNDVAKRKTVIRYYLFPIFPVPFPQGILFFRHINNPTLFTWFACHKAVTIKIANRLGNQTIYSESRIACMEQKHADNIQQPHFPYPSSYVHGVEGFDEQQYRGMILLSDGFKF